MIYFLQTRAVGELFGRECIFRNVSFSKILLETGIFAIGLESQMQFVIDVFDMGVTDDIFLIYGEIIDNIS